ncbi:hypothetical protein NURINAE_01045 [Candidatus Nitrosacidococcus sp. I8]|nr:hypothetical protein NURINAE_01045 [Candidatus Nitrosacidococcus sp. I8]
MLYYEVKHNHQFLHSIKIYPEAFGNFYYQYNNLVFGDLSVLVTSYLTTAKYKTPTHKVLNSSIVISWFLFKEKVR